MSSLLPLEDWRRIIGLHPFYFYNLTTASVEPRYPNANPSSVCLAYIRKYSWQGADYIGRADIENAIETAEKKIRDYLGYAIAPEYRDETVQWPRYYDHSRARFSSLDAHGEFNGVRLPFGSGYVQAVGVEALTLVGTVTTAGATLVYSDSDSDGLNDTFTITIATTETDPTKLAVYLAAADRLNGEAVGEKWRVRPISASITGGIATIKGRYWLLAKPILYEGVLAQPLDPTIAANFVSSLMVYTRTTNPDGNTVTTSQATLIWETQPCNGWWCSDCCGELSYSPADSSFDPAAQGMAIARAGIRDARTGMLNIGGAYWNATTSIWSAGGFAAGHEPDRVRVRFLSGWPLEDGQVAQKWQTIVARLAAAEMTRPICACEPANKQVHEWAFDLARSGGNNDERFALSASDLDSPFGTRRGQVYAWREVKNLRIAPATIDH